MISNADSAVRALARATEAIAAVVEWSIAHGHRDVLEAGEQLADPLRRLGEAILRAET